VSDKARTAAPDEIYLQGYVGSFHDGDVTWCDHRIEDDDVRYLRAPASGVEPVPCPACGSGDVGGGSGIVHCYKCKIEVKRETTALATLAWNENASRYAALMEAARICESMAYRPASHLKAADAIRALAAQTLEKK